jgi:hypothetical protein
MKNSLLAALIVFTLFFTIASAQESPAPPTLMQLGKLTASTTTSQFALTMSASGNTLLVGLTDVFVKPQSGWDNSTESATLAPSDGTAIFLAAAVSGNVVAVSAAETTTNTGDIYIFERPAGGWSGTVTESAILSDSSQGCFGTSIGISGGTIVAGIGRTGAFSFGNCVFVMPAGGWKNATQANATLNIPINVTNTSIPLAISGNTIVASVPGNFGSEGTLYVFAKPGAGWSGNLNPTATLIASDAGFNQDLGEALAISGNTIAATSVDPFTGNNGKVYVFVQPSGGWVDEFETAQLRSPKGALGFPGSIAISGNSILVGASSTTVGFNQLQGSAYVFLKPQSGWKSTSTANAELVSSDGQAGDGFGASVAIGGGNYFCGAPFANTQEGAAYVFGK